APPPAAAEGAPGAAQAPYAARGSGEADAAAPAPLGPGTTECADRQDPALRAIVEEYLPEVVGAPEAAITMGCRPPGERGVNLEVTAGAARGVRTVQYLPPGADRVGGAAEGAVSRPTASGGTVVVSSRGDGPGAAAPFADRLDALAAQLSPRL